MDIHLLSGPIIGGIIGYITNYIAVKMLFRPLKPIKIGNYTLPFTPGIIPKGKKRLSKAIGNAVGQNLLTQETLKTTLLSGEMKSKVLKDIKALLEKQTQNTTTIKEKVLEYVEQDEFETVLENTENFLTDKILQKLEDMNVGEIVAREGIKVLKQKIETSFLKMMVNDSLIESLSAPMVEAINTYMEENGQVIIYSKVSEECEKFTELQIRELMEHISCVDAISICMKVYERLVENELEKFVSKLNIAEIIEHKVNEMDELELEELILTIMKKELGAVVNLGAVIGFLLGIINIFFQ